MGGAGEAHPLISAGRPLLSLAVVAAALCAAPACRGAGLLERAAEQCVAEGWRTAAADVGGRSRAILWKGPETAWRNGAIIVLHGGGGGHSNACNDAGFRIGRPMVDFGRLALARGFAVFAPDSTEDAFVDDDGHSCGKRWDSLAREGRANGDLDFMETMIRRVIPAVRPAGSVPHVFLTGVSNGGFMTVLAATRLGGLVRAFAPVSAADPYGTYVDCRKGLVNRPNAPGTFRDAETRRSIAEAGACAAPSHPHKQPWPTAGARKPPFRLFYHVGDAGIDVSCKEKLRAQLREHGYPETVPFVVEDAERRSIWKHFWLGEYNAPLLDFFEAQARAH